MYTVNRAELPVAHAAAYLYGSELPLGLGGVADRETREKLEKNFIKKDPAWRQVIAMIEAAENYMKVVKEFKEKGLAGLEGLGIVPVLPIAIGTLKVANLVTGFISARKAKKTAKEVKKGVKMVKEDYKEFEQRTKNLVKQMNRLGIPAEAEPTSAFRKEVEEWSKKKGFAKKGKSSKYKYSRMFDGFIYKIKYTYRALEAYPASQSLPKLIEKLQKAQQPAPAPTPAPPIQPKPTIHPAVTQPVQEQLPPEMLAPPGWKFDPVAKQWIQIEVPPTGPVAVAPQPVAPGTEPLPTMSPQAATTVVVERPETAPAAPAEEKGAGILLPAGIALLALKVLGG